MGQLFCPQIFIMSDSYFCLPDSFTTVIFLIIAAIIQNAFHSDPSLTD